MKPRTRYLVSAIAATGAILAAVAVARAETCTLELKRLGSQTSFSPTDYIYRATNPQYFNVQIGSAGKNRITFPGQEEHAAAFKRIVKKEPKYESDHPFRGVAKLGTQEFAFVLDEAIPESEAKKAESEEKDSKSQTDDAKKDTKEAKSDSAISKLKGDLLQALSPTDEAAPATPIKVVGFNRLYFDANHNGDLTDDKVIEAETMPLNIPLNIS